MEAARSRSFWVTEAMVAAITTGDSAIGASAEDAEQELCNKIDKMIDSAPSMDAIIAVSHARGRFMPFATDTTHVYVLRKYT